MVGRRICSRWQNLTTSFRRNTCCVASDAYPERVISRFQDRRVKYAAQYFIGPER